MSDQWNWEGDGFRRTVDGRQEFLEVGDAAEELEDLEVQLAAANASAAAMREALESTMLAMLRWDAEEGGEGLPDAPIGAYEAHQQGMAALAADAGAAMLARLRRAEAVVEAVVTERLALDTERKVRSNYRKVPMITGQRALEDAQLALADAGQALDDALVAAGYGEKDI